MTTETQMGELKKDIHDIKLSNAEIYNVLVGSKISNDGGLIRRVDDLEIETSEIKKDLDFVKNGALKNDLYLKLLWWTLGIVTSATIMYIFNKIFKP